MKIGDKMRNAYLDAYLKDQGWRLQIIVHDMIERWGATFAHYEMSLLQEKAKAIRDGRRNNQDEISHGIEMESYSDGKSKITIGECILIIDNPEDGKHDFEFERIKAGEWAVKIDGEIIGIAKRPI